MTADIPWPRRAMTAANLPSYSALARSVGVHRETVSLWASGRRRPRAERIPRIATVLGVSEIEVRERLGSWGGAADVFTLTCPVAEHEGARRRQVRAHTIEWSLAHGRYEAADLDWANRKGTAICGPCARRRSARQMLKVLVERRDPETGERGRAVLVNRGKRAAMRNLLGGASAGRRAGEAHRRREITAENRRNLSRARLAPRPRGTLALCRACYLLCDSEDPERLPDLHLECSPPAQGRPGKRLRPHQLKDSLEMMILHTVPRGQPDGRYRPATLEELAEHWWRDTNPAAGRIQLDASSIGDRIEAMRRLLTDTAAARRGGRRIARWAALPRLSQPICG